MPGPRDNAPEVKQGDRLSAAKFNAIAGVGRRNIASPGMFQSGAMTAYRRAGGGGGDDERTLSNLAYVTEAATENGGVGQCVRLDYDLSPIGETDPEGEDYDPIEFRCGHQYVGCPVGTRINLFYQSLQHTAGGVPDPFTPDTVVRIGILTEPVDYLAQLTGYAIDRALVSGDTAAEISWKGSGCPEPD